MPGILLSSALRPSASGSRDWARTGSFRLETVTQYRRTTGSSDEELHDDLEDGEITAEGDGSASPHRQVAAGDSAAAIARTPHGARVYTASLWESADSFGNGSLGRHEVCAPFALAPSPEIRTSFRPLTEVELDRAKGIVLDLLGWGVQPEHLIECGISSQCIYRIFTDLHLRLPSNLSLVLG